uniref:Uncharacterized protein n=1 Tax=Arundo donax TaxID=35708 RepID=A0A0A9ANF7_ARUDO
MSKEIWVLQNVACTK